MLNILMFLDGEQSLGGREEGVGIGQMFKELRMR